MIVEVVCCSAEDCRIAESAGADRIELCCAIELDGLTPSVGLARAARAATRLPILAMLRPRPGNFRYGPDELEQMAVDRSTLADEGVDGFVLGALDERGMPATALQDLVAAARPSQTVFHRAFDACADPVAALERLVEMGFTRVLTSGLAPTAAEGAHALRTLRQQANGRIEIVAGGGVRAAHVLRLTQESGCDQVHLGAFVEAPGTGDARYGSGRRVDGEEVRRVVDALRGHGPAQ